MGRRAVFYLFNVVLGGVTLMLALCTVAGWMASRISPCESGFVSFMGLGLPVLLGMDLLLLVYWIVRRRWWAVVPAAVILLNAGFITAYFQVSFSDRSQRPHDLKVATYNVHGFRYSTFKITVESIAEVMKSEQVDVLCMQEFGVSPKYDLDSIKQAFYFLPYVYFPKNHGKEDGVALFSRYPILSGGLLSFSGTDNSALWVDLDVSGREIRLFNNHLQTTSISRSRREISALKNILGNDLGREREAVEAITGRLVENSCVRARQVRKVREIVDTTSMPVIVCGDFNDTPASYTYHQMKRGMKDGFRICGSGYGYTFRGFGRLLRIDYIFGSPELRGVRYYSLPLEWSDHNPVFMEFNVNGV